MEDRTLRKYIQSLNQMKKFFEDMLEEKAKPDSDVDYLYNFTKMKNLMKRKDWPVAAEKEQIVQENSKEDKIERAESIVNYATLSFKGMKVLDYDCGEGFVVREAAKEADFAAGFTKNEEMISEEKILITNQKEEIEKNGPYDYIFCLDIIDHIKSDPVELLKELKSLKSKDGQILLRCHPWTSRHGTHLYKENNLAFLHLIFTEKELITLGLKGQFTRKLLNPLKTYEQWIKDAGLSIQEREIHEQPVEMFFFKNLLLRTRIKKNWKDERGVSPVRQMEIQFVDYFLD